VLIFLKNNKIKIYKRNKNIFLVFGLDKERPWSYVFSFKMRNQGYVVLKEKQFGKLYGK